MKNILIIGSEGYLGTALVNRLKSDYNIFCIDKNPSSKHNIVSYTQIDFLDANFLSKLNDFLNENNVKFSSVVYLSGINFQNSFFSVQIEDWDKTFDINVKGFLFTLKSVWSKLHSNASVVVVASQNGIVGHENRIEYGPSKAALLQLVKNISVDIAKHHSNIRLNAVSPSYIINESNVKYLESPIGQKLKNNILYHRFITIDDVINSIQFLISDDSLSIRGQNLIIDNGYTIT